MRPEAEGTVYPPVTFIVDPDRVRAFGAVLNQTSGVPPTFFAVAEFTVLPQVFGDPRLGLDPRRVVHTSQSYLYERPLEEAETLEVHAFLESVKHRGGTGFLTVLMELREPGGALVATARSSLIERELPA